MVGSSYIRNHLGLTLTEEEMKDIPNPTAELAAHVTLKDIQAFGIIGTLIVGPISALRRPDTRNIVGIRRRMARCGLWGVALGCVAGPLMTYARTQSLDEAAIYDRCYRLRNNVGQVRVDRASIVGLFGGSALSIAVKKCPVTGGLLGMTAGVLGMAVYNNSISKNEKKEDKEEKEEKKK